MEGDDKSQSSRDARLAEALRANLRRRKAQVKARREQGAAEGTERPDPSPGETRNEDATD